MNQGRKPTYAQEVRDAVIGRVLDDGIALGRVLKELNAGTMEGFEALPVGYSTAYRWCDREKARRARNIRPDMAAYNAAAERLWRVIGRELDKMEREGKKAKPLEIKRVREMLGTLREAKALIEKPSKPKTSSTADQDTEETRATDGFLASLPDPSKDQSDTPETTPPPEHQDNGTDGGMDESAVSLVA